MDTNALADLRVIRAFWDCSPVPHALVSRDGYIEMVNGAWFDLLGYSRTELEGKHFRAITHPADLDADEAEVRRLLTDSGAAGYSLEKRYLHKRGAVVPVELFVSAIRRRDGPDVEFFAVTIVPLPASAPQAVVAGPGVLGRALVRCCDLVCSRPREFLAAAVLGLFALGGISGANLIELLKAYFK